MSAPRSRGACARLHDGPFTAATLLLAAALAGVPGVVAAQSPPESSSDEPAECEPLTRELAEAVRRWTQGTKHADWDEAGFRAALTGPAATRTEISLHGANEGLVGTYLFANEGNVPPVRTGREAAFYTLLKQRIASSSATTRLGVRDLLTLALDASTDGAGHANVLVAFLTVHNVVRAMARPRTWMADWNLQDGAADDPMAPVFRDLAARVPGSLPELLNARGLEPRVKITSVGLEEDYKTSDDSNMYWSMRLFGEEPGGAFEILRSSTGKASNGGAHYYFWVGAVGQGSIGMGGLAAAIESLVKWLNDDSVRSRRQLRHYWCGVGLANQLYARRGELANSGGLSMLSVDYPSALSAGTGGDVSVTWGGNPTFPVALVLEPAAGCPADCRSMSTYSSNREQPIVGSGFLECKLSTQTVSYRYDVHLADASGATTTSDPVGYTCLPTSREGIVNVSGGLDPDAVDYQVKKWDDRGFTFSFPPSFASFQLLEDGTARVSDTIVFREDNFLRADPTHNYGHIRRVFHPMEGRGDVNSASGKVRQCVDHVWYWGGVNRETCEDTWTELTWTVRRQNDGSYLLTLINGMPAGYADIPYRLR